MAQCGSSSCKSGLLSLGEGTTKKAVDREIVHTKNLQDPAEEVPPILF